MREYSGKRKWLVIPVFTTDVTAAAAAAALSANVHMKLVFNLISDSLNVHQSCTAVQPYRRI